MIGYSLNEIAEILTDKARPTLKGNTHWNAAMVKNIMMNERRWGHLEARKSIVIDHKSKKVTKNNNTRDSAYDPEHHEGIVTFEIAKAAHMVAASGRALRDGVHDLTVIHQGSLKGFISVCPFWNGMDMADADLGEFLEQANSRLSENEPRLAHITANDFYRFCAMGYQACGYDIAEKSPKEQYSRFADGRDDGLSEISPDSPEAFALWYHNSERFGGHPWEVCRGGNSTHIDLYVREDAQGWYLQVAGSAWTRCAEAALFFLALCRAGVPVCIYQAELLKARFLGEEKVGIVPSGVFPAYCHSYFPNEDIIDFTHLPNDKEKSLPYCVWQPLEAVKLKDGENNNA